MAAVPPKVMNWADECEDDDFTGPRPLMALPTAPRAARILNDDTIPTQPPFNAFLSNLPYDIKEDDLREFFDGMDIACKSIRLPTSSDSGGGRVIRGIGYVEYETREDMIEAISLPDPMMRNRRIRIDVSNPNEQKDRGSDRNRRYGNNEDRPERPIDTNWRMRSDKSPDRNGASEPPRENRRAGFGGGGFGRERMRDSSPRADDGSSWRSERKPDLSPPRRREFDRDDR
jgi:translation initiation factor 4B